MSGKEKTNGSLAMAPRVITIPAANQETARKLRVAAYTRVSSNSKDQEHSFAAQNAYFSKLINIQTIGFDKINQLRHVLFLKDKAHTLALMKQHAAILAPKFHAVLDALDKEIAPLGIVGYKRPVGGYFISVDVMPGCAKRVAQLCKDCGLTLTGAGAAFPYGIDPQDSHLRIAPTYPSLSEVETASMLLTVCVRLAVVEKLLAE